MAWKKTVERELDVEVNGVDYCIGFTLGFEGYRENYGADADGRRGEMRSIVECEATTDIPTRVQINQGDEWPDVEWATLPADVQAALITAMNVDADTAAENPEAHIEDEYDARDAAADAAYDYARENPDDGF